MEKIGIVKEIDGLGRLHIPKDVRDRLGLDKKVELVITPEGLLIKSDKYKLIRVNDNSADGDR